MSVGRNAVYTALFALLQTVPGFFYYGTRLKYPDDQAEQPALFLRRGEDEYMPREPDGRPAKVIMTAEVIVYYRATDKNETPVVELDTLLEAIEAAIAPTGAFEVQTLGGLVRRVYIEGMIQRDDGSLNGQAGLIIPLKILTTTIGP